MPSDAMPSPYRMSTAVMSQQHNFVHAAYSCCSPMFLIPLRRGSDAHENFVLQLQLPFMLVTSLEEYKR